MTQVTVKDEIRLFPAYSEPQAEELPMFAENRVHQRSSGNPYPNKVVMRVERGEKQDKPLRVITLENEYIRLELMPELGGRIYSALDKRTNYDFFYKQHVIKPALIGLLGSWISGGMEFNWPCHHRPSTYMPVDVSIEHHISGAVTVWMSENEPLDRMKGMVGIHLEPGEARFDTRMKVYNTTASRHSFLWWENAAVPVNESYRLIFPPDVHYVQFHYRKNVTSYPVASGVYNGIRMGDGVDISYHKNTRNPTSYFCAATDYDFFGGYDEGKQAGVIHVADHTVSVGKKMFTWAYNMLSRSWEKALTDTDGAYAELMASSYSLNQPDFAWLMPYECKEFNQMWYPVGAIGTPACACAEAAVAFGEQELRIQTTVPMQNASIEIDGVNTVFSAQPGQIVTVPCGSEVAGFVIRDAEGYPLLRYTKPAGDDLHDMPATIPDNPTLDKLNTAHELYLLGVHADQYRDPAVQPDGYWREALRRDPDHVPSLTALAEYELDHFRFDEAYELAQHAWEKATVRNFHPESGRLQYLMGRILETLGRCDEAWDWYMQSAWAQDSRSRALTRAAMISGRRGDLRKMRSLAEKALREHSGNETARILMAMADPAAKDSVLDGLLRDDPLNLTARALKAGAVPAFYDTLKSDPAQSVLDTVSELTDAGGYSLAESLLAELPGKTAMTAYVLAWLRQDEALLAEAAQLDVGIAYPSRLIEYKALRWAVDTAADDKSLGLLACMLYANGCWQDAAKLWEYAVELAPTAYEHRRNLAVAYYSHLDRRDDALTLLNEALALKPHDGQLIWEKALLMHRLSCDPAEIVDFLQNETYTREDIIIELCRALNEAGEYDKTLEVMEARDFTPCEGGEHAVAEQYMFACHAKGRTLLAEGETELALEQFRKAQHLPEHFGSGLWNDVLLVPHRCYEAYCLKQLGEEEESRRLTDWILMLKQDYFTDMNLPELPCWQALALQLQDRGTAALPLLAAHARAQKAAMKHRDAGYKKTTPFFISYMEDAEKLRKASCLWQLSMNEFAAGNVEEAAELASASLDGDPLNLYALLVEKMI